MMNVDDARVEFARAALFVVARRSEVCQAEKGQKVDLTGSIYVF